MLTDPAKWTRIDPAVHTIEWFKGKCVIFSNTRLKRWRFCFVNNFADEHMRSVDLERWISFYVYPE